MPSCNRFGGPRYVCTFDVAERADGHALPWRRTTVALHWPGRMLAWAEEPLAHLARHFADTAELIAERCWSCDGFVYAIRTRLP